MKKLILTSLSILCLSALQSFSYAAGNNMEKSSAVNLRNQLKRQIAYPEKIKIKGEVKTKVDFTINTKGEARVVSVEGPNSEINEFVKENVNNIKLDVDTNYLSDLYRWEISFTELK